MKKMRLVILLALSTLTFNSYGQNNTKTEKTNKRGIQPAKLVGTWRLIEFADLDTITGIWKYPYGKKPNGFFTYTKTNIVNINISSETPLKISEDSTKKYSINLYNHIWNNSFGYFGMYSIDFNKSIVTHFVKGGDIPYYIETDQPRPFIFKGDTLIIGDNKTWKRVLVRAD